MRAVLHSVPQRHREATGSLARRCASGPGPRGRRRVSRHIAAALVLASMAVAGCYTYVPFNAAQPDPGMQIEFELNDQGRVALGERLGPEVAKVDGSLVSATPTEYTLHVNRVQYLHGTASSWGGESVVLRQEDVKGILERRFSKGRTFAAIASGAVAVGAFIATRSLIGNGTGSSSTKSGGGPGNGQ